MDIATPTVQQLTDERLQQINLGIS